MKSKTLFIILAGISFRTAAQVTDIIPAGTPIANTTVARTDVWSCFSNPATLIQPETWQAAMQFENKYLIPELSTKLVQAAYTNNIMNIGIGFSHFGYSKYNEMLAGITLSRNFGGKFSIGVQGNLYASYFSDEAGYQYAFIPQVGMTAHLATNFTLGFHAFNPFQQNLRTDHVEKRLPSLFSLGTDLRFAEDFCWTTQIDKEVSSSFRFATGFEWDMVEQFTLKIGGYGSEYFVGCLGVGLHFGGFGFDLNSELHPVLGVNLLGNLSYKLK